MIGFKDSRGRGAKGKISITICSMKPGYWGKTLCTLLLAENRPIADNPFAHSLEPLDP